MCDSLCGVGPTGMIFAKNSDRPIGEVQLAVQFGQRSTAGGTLRTQYLSMGDIGAHAALLSCPTWLWGAEHGVNEFGVAIGNERVNTLPRSAQTQPALIGMDLVRLGLERARSAHEAVEVMTDLLTTHGQGGIADAVHQESYDSSFLIADASESFVLESSGSSFAVGAFSVGTALSNRLTLGTTWDSGSADLDRGEDFSLFADPSASTASADIRLAASRAFLAAREPGELSAAATAAHLRDHGRGPWGGPGLPGPASPPPSDDSVVGASICMHTNDRSVTAASMIAVLPLDLAGGAPVRAYVALGSPCSSIFLPTFPITATGPPPFVPRELFRESLWRAVDAVRVRIDDDPDAIGEIRAALDPVEDEIWAEADEVFEYPDRWNDVGSTWGPRALSALTSCID